MKSSVDSLYTCHNRSRVCQGDIFRDWKYDYQIYLNEDNRLTIDKIDLPYIIVLSQDCDLKEDVDNRQAFKKISNDNSEQEHDKYLQSILICPAYLAEQFRQGKHLANLNLRMQYMNKERWNSIKTKQKPRYHYLEGDIDLQVPNLVIDFKHYFTIPRDQLYNATEDHYLATVNELFRESLSQRFAYYLSRIGLPELTSC